MSTPKAIVVYSGGMDSFTLLMDTVKRLGSNNITAISFNYKQRHKKELKVAEDVCRGHGIRHFIVNLESLNGLLPGSSLTDSDVDVPLGHYEEESMKATVVPNRNMIMLSIASAHAIAVGAEEVLFGAHAGDHAIYPDCRSEFVQSMNETIRAGNYDAPIIKAPYITMTKGQILMRGLDIGLVVNDYLKTWTCYKGGEFACGACGACQERLESFAENLLKDPIPYVAATYNEAEEAD